MAPQLAVSLYCADPGFAAEAKRRIVARCPIVDNEQFCMGQTRDLSAKNLASLLYVLADVQSEATWVAIESSAPEVIEVLREDHHSAGPSQSPGLPPRESGSENLGATSVQPPNKIGISSDRGAADG